MKKQKSEYRNKNKEPMGWALSINIKRMADKYGLTSCPTCEVDYEFDERLGFYKCPCCKSYGGLKKFAKLCIQNKSNSDIKTNELSPPQTLISDSTLIDDKGGRLKNVNTKGRNV